MKPRLFFSDYFKNELSGDNFIIYSNINVIAITPPATGKCLPTFYLSNKKFAVTKYRFDLIYWLGMMSKNFLTKLYLSKVIKSKSKEEVLSDAESHWKQLKDKLIETIELKEFRVSDH